MLVIGASLFLIGSSLFTFFAIQYYKESRIVSEISSESESIFSQLKYLDGYPERLGKEGDGDEDFSPKTVIWNERPQQGEQFGYLQIPRLKVKIPLISGVGDEELKKGIGHHRESVLPGEADNSVFAGHRETALKDAGKIKEGDQLVVITNQGTFTYTVKKVWVTDAEDRSVIVSHGAPKLTLYTCYPFDMIGYAPERYIIQASLD